jgi:hypothetical protein
MQSCRSPRLLLSRAHSVPAGTPPRLSRLLARFKQNAQIVALRGLSGGSTRSGEPFIELLPRHGVQDRYFARLHSEFGEATRFTGALRRPESCDRNPNGVKQGPSLDRDGMLDAVQVGVRNARDLHVERVSFLPFVRLLFYNDFRAASIYPGIGTEELQLLPARLVPRTQGHRLIA